MTRRPPEGWITDVRCTTVPARRQRGQDAGIEDLRLMTLGERTA